jgi:uncharacterized protein
MEVMQENKARTWTMLCHLSALIILLGIPFGNILGPFIVWLFKKNEYPSVDEQGRESMNFQISMSIYAAITLLIAIGLTPFLIGILFYPVVAAIAALDIILTIVATVRASDNISYHYPLALRILK